MDDIAYCAHPEWTFYRHVFSESQVKNHNYGTGYQCIVYRDAFFILVCVNVATCSKTKTKIQIQITRSPSSPTLCLNMEKYVDGPVSPYQPF